MDMLISYFNGKDFLALYIYRNNMYFQISFLIFYMPFLSHPLRPLLFVTFIPVLSIAMMIYSSLNSLLLLLLSVSFILMSNLFILLCLLCSVIRDGRDFAFSIALCNSFISLSIRKMKVHFSIS